MDYFGNAAASAAAANVVVDTTPPSLLLPISSVTAVTNSAAGLAVHFNVAASDALDPHPVLMVDPPSGSVFPVGQTSVRVSAIDTAGNRAEAIFLVVVGLDVATEPPVMIAPADDARAAKQLPIAFSLTEPAMAGTVTLTFSQGSESTVLVLSRTHESAADTSSSCQHRARWTAQTL
jgi:hypothetical protein